VKRNPSPGSRPPEALVQIMAQRHGLDISAYEASFLRQARDRRCAETGSQTAEAYGDCLAGSRAEAEAFYQSLHVGYSEFFRNPITFALLEQQVLPALSAATGPARRSELRVWSAGCAAGHEAWSVAILLAELAGTRADPGPFRIIATDISAPALAAARLGVYDQAAVQNVRLKHLRDYFSVAGASYTVAPRLRALVDFSSYDLLDERSVCPPVSLYGDFDLILCCNVLFYYRAEIRQRILDKVCAALAPGGYFVTGEAEREIVARREELRALAPPAAVFQKQKHNHGLPGCHGYEKSKWDRFRPPSLSVPSVSSVVKTL